MVQWLGLYAFTAEYVGSIPGQGTIKIPQAVMYGQMFKKKKKVKTNRFEAMNADISAVFLTKSKWPPQACRLTLDSTRNSSPKEHVCSMTSQPFMT